MILYQDPANPDQLDGMTWDGRTAGRIAAGIRYAAVMPNSAGTRYVLGGDVYDRSGTLVAQVPVDSKVFGGVWADDQIHYCEVARISPDAPPQGEPGMLRVGVPGQPPRDVTRIGTYYPRGFNAGGPGVAACSIQQDLAIIGQSAGQGIGTEFYSAVQLSTGKVLWTHTPPTTGGVVEIVASRDGRYVAENRSSQSGSSSATIYEASGGAVAHLPEWVQAFSADDSLVVVSPMWMGGAATVVRWSDQTAVWSGPTGGAFPCIVFAEPNGSRLALGLRSLTLPQSNGCEPIDLYVVDSAGRVVMKRNDLFLVPPLW